MLRKRKTAMRNKIGSLLILIGVIFIFVSVYQYFSHKIGMQRALEEAESKISLEQEFKPKPIVQPEVDSKEAQQAAQLAARQQFDPQDNDVIGVLKIPKIEAKLPIIEGTDEEMLAKGVGHYRTTAFPMDNEQILLSGHRDTVFRNFGELEIGDRLIVEMPYGTFEYSIEETEIVSSDNTTVIGPKGEEVLTLSTCYPFRYVGDAPDRFIVYAYPVEDE
ncbi:Sortase (surface protein transpeptidase) [Chlamydia abortus]|nr:Sortase (surface protein transpeptidase) [Chlamydia abortus]